MTDFTYYVRSDSPDDLGNGTEDRIDGPNRAFRTWMGAEAALQGDLVTPGDTVTILGRAGAYTRVVWDGWTTSATNRIFVGAVAGEEHDGVIGGGIVFENDADFFTTFYSLEYLSARDIEIRNPRAGGGGCLFLQTGSGTHERLILGPSAAYGADFNSSPNNLDACVIYDCATFGIRYQSFRFGTVRNSGIFKSGGNGVELQGGAGNCTFYNTVSHGNTGSDFTGDSFLGSHNASGDGTQPGASGVPAVVDGDFTDFANDDYTLAGTGSQLYDAGNAAELPALDITNTAYTTSDIGAYAFAGTGPVDHQVNLGNAATSGTDAGIPTITAPDAGEDQIINLGNAATVGVDAAIPQITVPIRQEIFLANAARSGVDASVPTIDVPVDQTVTLGNAATASVDAAIPTVVAGADAIITLGNAATAGIDAGIPPIVAEITHFVNLGNAATAGIDASVPTVEGESDLPPSIITPTQDQTYTFGQSGTLPAPPHDVGTGDNPQWSLAVDDFSTKPGVNQWTIDANTGTITYNVKMLTTDPNEQALNTKGPYTTTRRLTTTVGNADETFKIFVNVGNYTLQMTPGTPCMTWNTKTPGARGVEAGFDPSNRVTQTYTVT